MSHIWSLGSLLWSKKEIRILILGLVRIWPKFVIGMTDVWCRITPARLLCYIV